VQALLSEAPLSSQERMLLGLAYFHERTLREISEMTALPLGTVKSSLGRARGKLRDQFIAGAAPATDQRKVRQGAGA
jgi:DNA-directed RNA polymerase specialized sigma24 family protein